MKQKVCIIEIYFNKETQSVETEIATRYDRHTTLQLLKEFIESYEQEEDIPEC